MFIKMEEWNGVEIGQGRVNDMIRDTVKMALDREKHGPIAYTMTGDTLVFVTNYPNESIEVTVATVRQRGSHYDPATDPDTITVY